MSGREVHGRIVVHARGFGFLEPQLNPATQANPAPESVEKRERKSEGHDGHDVLAAAFITPPDLNPFLEGDRVVAHVEEAEGRFTATRLRLVERTRHRLFGKLVWHGRRAFLRVDRQVSNTDWPLLIGANHPLQAALQSREAIFVVASLRGTDLIPERIVEETEAGLERVVVRHALPTEFSTALLAEAQTAAQQAAGKPCEPRRDLRALKTITIDAPVSRDLDDALAVLPAPEDGGLRLFVSISDVDAFVPEGSALDLEARQRATSVYLAGRVLPMLPTLLSEEALSLLPGQDRAALTVELRIDPEGCVTSVDIYTSLIRSHARLSYDQVTSFLDDDDRGDIPEDVLDTLRWLRTSAARIGAVRNARGGVQFVREEAYIAIDDASGEPTQVDARPSTSAHSLVERLMVAANEAVARWLVERGQPGLFRVHDQPEPAAVHSLSAFAANFGFHTGFGNTLTPRALAAFEAQFEHTTLAPALYSVLGRVLGPARYTVHPLPHFGLAASLYLHFTSPIRRYADLTVHRIVKGYLAGQRDRHAGEPQLEQLASHINHAAFRATKAEMERLRTLSARLFMSRTGETHQGRIVRIQPFGLVVQLGQLGVSGTLATDALPGGPFHFDRALQALRGATRDYMIGEAIEVRVQGANEELGRIDLGVSVEIETE